MPTPPEPPQMQTRLPSSSSATSVTAPAPAARRAVRARRGRARARTGTAARAARRSSAGGEPCELLALRAGARVLGDSAARSAARTTRRLGVARAPRSALAAWRGAEALRVARVDDDRVELEPELLAQAAPQHERLVDRHLLRQRDRDDAGLARGRAASRRSCGPGARSGRRARSRANVRGRAQHAERRARSRARRRSRGRRARAGHAAALGCASSHDLADRHQLAHPRRRGGEVRGTRARRRAGRRARAGALVQVLLHRACCGSIEIANRPLVELDLLAPSRPSRAERASRRAPARLTSATIVRCPRRAAAIPSAARRSTCRRRPCR